MRELAPLPGQVELALAQVHHRRRQSRRAAAASCCAVALLAVLVTRGGPGGVAGVEPAAPGVAPSRSASPSTSPSPRAESVRAAGPRPSASLSASALVAVPSGTPSASVRPRPAYRPRDGVVVTEFRSKPGAAFGGTPDIGWDGTRLWMTLDVRPLPGETFIRFPGEQELDLVIRPVQSADTLWRWGAGQRFGIEQHDVPVVTGNTVRWRVTWDLVLDDGTPLPPGRYDARVQLLSSTHGYLGGFAFRIDENGRPEVG